MVSLKLNEYQVELLAALYEAYPSNMRRSKLLAIMSDKDPKKLDRELAYLQGHNLVSTVSFSLSLPLTFGAIPMKLPMFKITVEGIDLLKSTSKDTASRLRGRPAADQPVAFISASFDDHADGIIEWVRNRAHNVGFVTLWLKEVYKARPTAEKIKQAILESDCLIQILTPDVFEKNGEVGWIGNEIGMAYMSTPGRRIAAFVDKQFKASGLAKAIADTFPFDVDNLPRLERKAEEYLRDLMSQVKV